MLPPVRHQNCDEAVSTDYNPLRGDVGCRRASKNARKRLTINVGAAEANAGTDSSTTADTAWSQKTK